MKKNVTIESIAKTVGDLGIMMKRGFLRSSCNAGHKIILFPLDLLRNYVRYEIFKFGLRRSKNYEAYTAYMLNNFCKAAAQIWESQ